MPTRRTLLKAFAGTVLAGAGFASYAFAVEPGMRLIVKRYWITPRGWPSDMELTLAALADLHVCEPHMPAARVAEIVAATNALKPDVTVLLGDYIGTHRFVTRRLAPQEWAEPLGRLTAPLGVYSILGNHDWWHAIAPGIPADGARTMRRTLQGVGIPVLENDAVRLKKDGRGFWLIGLGDQIAHILGPDRFRGVDDLPAALAQVDDAAPVILLAHEPDIFPTVPARVSLTLAGHTHGGQVRMMGYSPVVPSGYGNRYAYGLVAERGRTMIVSGGLGTSIVPVRLGVPPEIVLVHLGGQPGPLT